LTVAFFFNLVDIAAYNALVLWITMNPNWHQGKSHARRLLLRELGMSLTNDHASERFPHHIGKRLRIQACARRHSFRSTIIDIIKEQQRWASAMV